MRLFSTLALLCALLALGACQSSFPTGATFAASASSDSNLATIRSSRGLPRLRADAELERAALKQSGYMAQAGRMSHTARHGFAKRMRDGDIEGAAAENIAHGGMEQGKLLSMWMNSSGHRRNMLNPKFTRYGLASVEEAGGTGRKYWTLVLGQ